MKYSVFREEFLVTMTSYRLAVLENPKFFCVESLVDSRDRFEVTALSACGSFRPEF
jgi:hypothetical protein